MGGDTGALVGVEGGEVFDNTAVGFDDSIVVAKEGEDFIAEAVEGEDFIAEAVEGEDFIGIEVF